ncbi:MAG TPA: hypothetical protein VHB48_08860 [Chitinophagaceae bacterium]|nr:hypothetical protein [Chitinophagaceae bacterium]
MSSARWKTMSALKDDTILYLVKTTLCTTVHKDTNEKAEIPPVDKIGKEWFAQVLAWVVECLLL